MTDIDLLPEIRERLINIENKINILMKAQECTGDQYGGHPDQEFGHISYAQHGEDFIVLNVFTLLGMEKPTYLDVGAHSPFNISNTTLLYARGSTGINVEANPDLIDEFRRHRARDKNLNVGVAPRSGLMKFYRIDRFSGRNTFSKEAAESFVRDYPQFKITDVLDIEVVTLNELVDKYSGGIFPQFMTIDIEGLDYEVLRATDFSRSSPILVCVEAVSALGSASTRMADLMRTKGFVPYVRTTGNLFFISKEAHTKLAF